MATPGSVSLDDRPFNEIKLPQTVTESVIGRQLAGENITLLSGGQTRNFNYPHCRVTWPNGCRNARASRD